MMNNEWAFLPSADEQRNIFVKIFKDVKWKGRHVRPRGQLCVELENYSYELPPYVRFVNFSNRKLNLSYIKNEFLWYIKGDRFDTSICDHAKLWNQIKNDDGSINSNYGQYIFGKLNQFDIAANNLINDVDSRRASIMILNSDHIASDTKDLPCTYAINFRIRANKLNMSVRMRSQDAIYGFGNDVPAFSMIHEMMLQTLRAKYPNLEHGNYHHTADSFHVYEKHFEMLEKLASYPKNDDFELVKCPKISGPDEVKFLRTLDYSNIPSQYKFTEWLLTR